MEKIKIITHDRVAHADDVFAAAVLHIIYGHSGVEVVRTRDSAVLAASAGAENTFLLDIGGVYDPTLRLFDHHQPAGAGFRNAEGREWPYATAGLVWRHYGAQAVAALHPSLTEVEVAETVQHIDDYVMRFIDAVDCGVWLKSSGPSLSSIIASFNNSWWESKEDVFPLVCELAQVVLTNFIKRYAGKVMAREKVRKSRLLQGGSVLLLDGAVPWVDIVAEEMPDVLFVVYPVGETAASQQWQIRAAVGPQQAPRIKFPFCWGGLERKALARVCGEDEAVFCHRSLHLAGASTLEGALSMAARALQIGVGEAIVAVA